MFNLLSKSPALNCSILRVKYDVKYELGYEELTISMSGTKDLMLLTPLNRYASTLLYNVVYWSYWPAVSQYRISKRKLLRILPGCKCTQ